MLFVWSTQRYRIFQAFTVGGRLTVRYLVSFLTEMNRKSPVGIRTTVIKDKKDRGKHENNITPGTGCEIRYFSTGKKLVLCKKIACY